MNEIPLIASLHLIVGAITVSAGAGALILRKGSRWHRASGHVFFASMLMLCASGVYMSITRSIIFTFFLAIFSAYLVLTGWVSARRNDGEIGLFEKIAFFFVLLNTIALFLFGILESVFGISTGGDVPAGAYFFLAGLAAVFSALDYSVIKRGELIGKYRIARHLWRMCFSMLIASTIFFLGNSQVLPEVFQHPYFLNTPVLAIFIVMMFWLVRTLLTPSRKQSKL